MTDTTHEAPERIWAWGWRADSVWQEQTWQHEDEPMSTMEYVRADLFAALTEQLAAARKDAEEAEAYAAEVEAERKKTYEALLKVTRIHDEVEAKLAKAVEALENVIGEYDLFRKYEYERGLAPLDDEIHNARAALLTEKPHDRA